MEQLLAKLGADGLEKLNTASAADLDAMIRFAQDISPPAEPVLDYITEVDSRRILFDEFQAICQPYHEMANATIFAVFMVAPISEIRIYLQLLRDSAQSPQLVSGIVNSAPQAIRAYLPRARSPEAPALWPLIAVPSATLNEPGMPVHSTSVIRSVFSDKVKDRDRHLCVFSGVSDPQAAHIFPFATSKSRKWGSLNAILMSFWGSDKSMAWRRAFEDAGITQSAKNGISMNHQIHFWFDNARFALKPLREIPGEGIIVQWHWLKRSVLKPLMDVLPNQYSCKSWLYAGLTDGSWGDNLAHRPSGVAIRTGQTFLLRSSEEMPSWGLLEMQWDLLRVAAISGAAEVTDDYYDYDNPREDDEAVAARLHYTAVGQAVIAGQGSILAKEETKEETPAKGKEEAKEEITAKEAGKEKEEGRATNNYNSDIDDDIGGSKARRG